MKKSTGLLFIAFIVVSSCFGQNQKKPLNYQVYDSWKTISNQQISQDGNWLVWTEAPQKGDGVLFLRAWDAGSTDQEINRGSQPGFSPNSDFLVFKVVPQEDSIRKAKLDKVKTEKMPKDSLGIYLMANRQLIKYANVKSFKVPEESASWIAFQIEEVKGETVSDKKDTTKAVRKDEKQKKKPEFNGQTLVVMNPVTKDSQSFEYVTEYGFTKKGNWLYMVAIQEDSLKKSILRVFDTKTGLTRELWDQTGIIKNLVADENGTELAFLFSKDTSKQRNFSLCYWPGKETQPVVLVDTLTQGMIPGQNVSENGRLNFSPDGKRLFFTTARKVTPTKTMRDSLLEEDKVSVDIWHWQEDVLQSMQLKQAEQERKKSYQALVDVKKGKMIQLADSAFIESYRLVRQGDSDMALGYYTAPYKLQNAISSTSLKDVYLKSLVNGETIRVFENVSFSPQLSPEGRFLYWWEPVDSSWYCYSIRDRVTRNLTKGLSVGFVQEDHDTPDEPGSYGIAGWSENDGALYLYDQFDIWKMDPAGKESPLCITNGYGRTSELVIRYLSTDPDEKFLDVKKENLFSLKHETQKKSGFAKFTLEQPTIKILILDDCAFGRPVKAKEADRFLWTRSTVSEFPDLRISGPDFTSSRKISNANPQQMKFIWATVELVDWKDLNGEWHQGLLYKPENMDPSKKYPMIVYFYERHSDGLHTHYSPRFSASTVNPVEYCSNGYLLFMPDIHFSIGFPGQSFYNAIMSGILELGKRPYVDMERLGIQGQSWGGYGTAYMITRTNIFKAASPGAPVSNMTSAYGGIRTESGMVRQFQYEKTQSRIGGTLWEKPELFMENSPLFFADRINTPCLIRHDDADGAVPFSEGVQLFVALRRLGKPAWLVNYNGQPHNLSRLADKKDWSIRMLQFFDHYLKEEPAPDWMIKGVPAIDKKGNEYYYRKFTDK